jgi:hypothetical protein
MKTLLITCACLLTVGILYISLFAGLICLALLLAYGAYVLSKYIAAWNKAEITWTLVRVGTFASSQHERQDYWSGLSGFNLATPWPILVTYHWTTITFADGSSNKMAGKLEIPVAAGQTVAIWKNGLDNYCLTADAAKPPANT